MNGVAVVLFVVALLILLDIAAWLGAVDSRDAADNPEFENRRIWPARFL
jgi:hypothetical protein